MISTWLGNTVQKPNEETRTAALQHQLQLTKPPGSLGQLENLAVQLCVMQETIHPRLDEVTITIFAADHGVAESGVSAFPQEVTAQMVANFAHGGAAISVLSSHLGARLEVVDVGTVSENESLPGVVKQRIAAGTANLEHQDAMSEAQLSQALDAGRDAVLRGIDQGMQLFIGGDMGIANTTSAAAIGSALLGMDPVRLVGPGTGLDESGVSHKAKVISHALSRYQGINEQPLEILRCLGGFEIAALVGAYLSCAQQGIPALVDGYITTAAALVAVAYEPAVQAWLLYSHRSAEPGHLAMLEKLQAQPLLDLGMRLGEGSGAATAVPLLRMACALHNDMATFADAGVAEG